MYRSYRPVHSEVRQLTLSFRFIRILTLFIQLKHHDLPPPRVGFRQPNCYGKFLRLFTELITLLFLLNQVLFD